MAEIPSLRFGMTEGYLLGMTDADDIAAPSVRHGGRIWNTFDRWRIHPRFLRPHRDRSRTSTQLRIAGAGTAHCGLTIDAINRSIEDKSCRLWVDIDLCEPGQGDLLKQIKGLHPLSVEDALAQNSRPKLEEYPDYLFVVIIGVRLHEETPDPYDLATYDLCFFLGSTFLITVHEGPSAPVEEVVKRLEKNPDVLARGVDRLAHAIMDGSVDAYFPILDKLDEFVDEPRAAGDRRIR